MKTRSTLTGKKHAQAEYEAAKEEPVVLTPFVSATWKAPHFVWQVRQALGRDPVPGGARTTAPRSTPAATRSPRPSNYDMQKNDREVGLRGRPGTERQGSRGPCCARKKIPRSAWGWILGLRGHNIHNAAAGVIDYRTGEVLAYVGSASYTSKGNKKFQPQFDVMADGWRQPGSAIKPIDYLDRHRRQAS